MSLISSEKRMISAIDSALPIRLGLDIIAIIWDMVACKKCQGPIRSCPKCVDNTRVQCLDCHSAKCISCSRSICYEHTVPKVYPFICQGDCYKKRGPSWGWFRKIETSGSLSTSNHGCSQSYYLQQEMNPYQNQRYQPHYGNHYCATYKMS